MPCRTSSRCTASTMPTFPSPTLPDETWPPAQVERVERMFALAPSVGVDLKELNEARVRLEASEAERWGTKPGPERAAELDKLSAACVETICKAVKAMTEAVDSEL
jgi:hypothetical protein